MPDGLTLKQRKFAAEYVKRNGNGTQAALAAGYGNGDPVAAAARASENVRKRKVRQHIERITRRWDISAERVLGRLDNLSAKAEEEGNFGAAVKAEELIGKSLGMWVERSLNVTVDMTDAHLQALRDLAARGKGQPKVIDHVQRLEDRAGEAVGLAARAFTGNGMSMAGGAADLQDRAVTPDNSDYDKFGEGA